MRCCIEKWAARGFATRTCNGHGGVRARAELPRYFSLALHNHTWGRVVQSASMAPTATAKRVKVSHSPSTQPNLRDLFAKQCSSPGKKSTEDAELEWAIQESLKASQCAAGERGVVESASVDEVQSVPVVTPCRQEDAKQELGEGSSRAGAGGDVDTTAPTKFNAFSRLMTSHSEAKEWAAADAAEVRNYGNRSRQRKTAPFYKILTGMPICVDGFRFGQIDGCTAYFLSHFHADHYGGITSTWDAGPIYCSQTTANLVRTSLHVQSHLICPLPFDVPTTIPGTGGVRVTLLDANHCPGSCLFLFEGPQTRHILPLPPASVTFRYLHCGDFRASPRHTNHPLIKGKRLDIIYLDTTYCNPRYCFPAQEMVVQACAEMVRRAAPEQCRMEAVKRDDDEADWRVSPLKGKQLRAALEAEENKPSVDAMRGWLDSGKSESKGEYTVKEEEEDVDLGDLDFQDEEIAFKGEDEMGDDGGEDEEGEGDVASEQKGGSSEAPILAIKDEEGPEEDSRAVSVCKGEHRTPSPTAPLSPRVLVVVGTYTIGKEKIVIACARALGTRVYCADARKYSVYAQLEDAELHSLLTRDPLKANVHVTSLMTINGDALREHTSRMRSMGMQVDRAIAFRPTGWTYRPPAGADLVSPSLDRVISWNQGRQFSWTHLNPTRDSTEEYSIYGVPYSEHSSFFELSAFALSVDYVRIIATVNVGNPTSRAKMARWFEKWKAEKKRRNYRPVEPRTDDYY